MTASDFTPFGLDLTFALRADQGRTTTDLTSAAGLASTDRALSAIEPDYAPRIASVAVDGQTVSFGPSGARAVTAPAGATELRVTFFTGLRFTGAGATLTEAPLAPITGFRGVRASVGHRRDG